MSTKHHEALQSAYEVMPEKKLLEEIALNTAKTEQNTRNISTMLTWFFWIFVASVVIWIALTMLVNNPLTVTVKN